MRYAVHAKDGELIGQLLYAVDAVGVACSHHPGATVRVNGTVAFTVEQERMPLLQQIEAADAVRIAAAGAAGDQLPLAPACLRSRSGKSEASGNRAKMRGLTPRAGETTL